MRHAPAVSRRRHASSGRLPKPNSAMLGPPTTRPRSPGRTVPALTRRWPRHSGRGRSQSIPVFAYDPSRFSGIIGQNLDSIGDDMRMPGIVGACTFGFLLLGVAAPGAAQCEPDGEVQFLCGPPSPEDLAPVPRSPWVIVSSMVDEGNLYVADTRDHTATVVFPIGTAAGAARHHDLRRVPGPGVAAVQTAWSVPELRRRGPAHPVCRRPRRAGSD